MSKSLGNVVSIAQMAQQWRPVELRYYLGSAHYRSAIEYSPQAMDEAAAAWRRIENFLSRAQETHAGVDAAADVPEEFAAAMDDDLGVPGALAVLHNRVREGNAALTDGAAAAGAAYADVRAMVDVLGLDSGTATSVEAARLTETVDRLVSLALQQRQAARDRKDYQAADAVRDALADAGVAVEDTPAGPRWKLEGR
jgi:cysteinyl-tRNA synthetase